MKLLRMASSVPFHVHPFSTFHKLGHPSPEPIWIHNVVVLKGTNAIFFLQALDNWNSLILKGVLLDLNKIDPGQIKLFVEMNFEQAKKLMIINITNI